MEFGTPQFWVAAMQIVVIDILLSGDNAVVIALACRSLPLEQRRWGIIWGVAGAIGVRVLLTFFAITLLDLPLLKVAGGILLVWIGVKLIRDEEEAEVEIPANDRLLAAIRTIILADVAMGVDNVIGVAGAAKGSLLLLLFGLALSIPLVVAGSQIIIRIIGRFPILILAGGGLLGFIAGDMIITDVVTRPWVDANARWLHWALPVAGVVLVVGLAKWLGRNQTQAT